MSAEVKAFRISPSKLGHEGHVVDEGLALRALCSCSWRGEEGERYSEVIAEWCAHADVRPYHAAACECTRQQCWHCGKQRGRDKR